MITNRVYDGHIIFIAHTTYGEDVAYHYKLSDEAFHIDYNNSGIGRGYIHLDGSVELVEIKDLNSFKELLESE